MPSTAPGKPILALTLGVAGKRRIDGAKRGAMEDAMTLTFRVIADRLAALRTDSQKPSLGLRFDLSAKPRLTLITGLADGADLIACDLFKPGDVSSTQLDPFSGVDRVLGAVLPCGPDDFVANSAVDDIDAYTAAVGQCQFVLELDGLMEPQQDKLTRGDPLEIRQLHRDRADAFTGQAEILLRNADVLIAIDDPQDEGHPGGTRQTMGRAIDLGLPVILVLLGEPGLAILHSRSDLDDPTMLDTLAAQDCLRALVDELVATGAVELDAGEEAYCNDLIEEFFAIKVKAEGWANRIWAWFGGLFPSKVTSDAAEIRRPSHLSVDTPEIYRLFKDRASLLSSYYASLGRGYFVLSYGLAVFAVLLAVIALSLLSWSRGAHWPETIVDWLLISLGILKLVVVGAIWGIARRAKTLRLSQRAADYRYFSERMRTMTFLPHVGALRTIFNWSLPYTTRLNAQGVFDHLFAAVVRQAPPLTTVPGAVAGKFIRPDATGAVEIIRAAWIRGQEDYHHNNHIRLSAMKGGLESLVRTSNWLVIVIVALDIVVALELARRHFQDGAPESLEIFGPPLLIAIAAFLPAAVAGLNGIRFQSECARLADRSKQIAAQLRKLGAGPKISAKKAQRPVRVLDALRLAEDVTRLTIDEVAEWSAIYGKDFIEP